MSATTAAVTSLVPALPPRSAVMTPATQTLSTERMRASAAPSSPSQRSISAAVQKVATGLATPLPVMSKAEPWMGSNMEGFSRVGSRLLVGAMPMEPARAAARSERMSACWTNGDNGVEGLGLEHHPRGHGVDEHLVHGDVGEVFGDLGGYLIPQDHAVALGVALGDDGEEAAGPGPGGLEGEAHQPLDAVAGEDGDLGGRLPGLAAVGTPALARVLALAVLAHDDPVQVAGGAVPERGLRAGEDAGGTHVGVLLEGLADGQAEAPEGDMVRNI
ncbi:hypothetical protein N3K66_000265 [Trichothecium roseum]|uniref:Uncharacterized protein n=1 Tax=Trichothecium roseum TaxID=47278 RepID=A0ACC0VBE0_9HYPO|nr:hypothetical protein N3K66_000265 [Trichothecium roseum]